MRRGRLVSVAVWLVAALCLLAMPAPAQKDEGEIVTNILVNYGSAYKDGTWAPVDVLVKNDKRDVKGWLEVRTYVGETLQSPVYRQAIDLPKNSQKRFQFHCYFSGTSGLSVQLFDGRRPVLEFPHELPGLRPIAEGDLLSLVLDDEGSGFSFLYMALNPNGGNRGVHRESVDSTELPFLSEHPQSYEPLDFIIMGEVDPERITPRVQELLREYVRRGGVLAICTGSHAVNYRGSAWIEDLTGTVIGPEAPVDEAALAKEVFPPETQEGARTGHECMVASLEAKAPEVQSIGTERALAMRRPLGSGFVYTLAVDADSRALQECEGYEALWREICTSRTGIAGLNFGAAADFAVEALPQVSGIVIHSKSSVIAYLALYFIVAIVGNWLFFSWLKRREWAWAALVVFAVGFTAYAMIYGTTGRARSSELHQLQVVRVPVGGGLSSVDSFVGILTAHTAEYAMTIDHPAPLAEDLYFRWLARTAGMPGMSGGFGSGSRPFTLIQGATPRIEGFRIGASELRLARVSHDTELGGLEGSLVFDDAGLHGELVNKTGLSLSEPFLFFRGRRYNLSVNGDRIPVEVPVALISGQAPIQAVQPGGNLAFSRSRPYGNVRTGPLPAATLRRQFPDQLLVAANPGNFNTGMVYPDQPMPVREDLGPFVCGWSQGKHFPVVTPDTPLRPNLNETLVVADVAVEYKSDPNKLRDFSDIQQKAANRSIEIENVTADDLEGLEAQVSATVRQAPNHPAASDLVGNFSQLTERFGRYRPATELAAEWGVQGPEAAEAALWDHMIERWWMSDPFPLPAGWQSMMDIFPPHVQTLMTGDLTPVINGQVRGKTIDDDRVLGFVYPDRPYIPEGQAQAAAAAAARGPAPGLSGRRTAGGGLAGLAGSISPQGRSGANSMGCYLLTELWSPDERTVKFAHGSDDWARIFVNGMEVHRNAEGRDADPNQDHFAAQLHQGRNVVFAICGNEVQEWEFSLAMEEGGEGVEVRLPGGTGSQVGPVASAHFGDLLTWAVERTGGMDTLTAEDLDELTRQVQTEVQRDPADGAVSDLIGNLSQLTERLGRHRPASELAAEWGVQGAEATEAALWDHMIEEWGVSTPFPLPAGAQSMMEPFPPPIQALVNGDLTPIQNGQVDGEVIHDDQTLGFVYPVRLFRARQQGMPPGRRGSPMPPPGQTGMDSMGCYLYAELQSPDERTVRFASGSDDWVRIFVNGQEVHQVMDGRNADPAQDHFSAQLHAGRNVVFVVSGNEVQEWEFSLAFEEGGEGVEVRLPETAQGRP